MTEENILEDICESLVQDVEQCYKIKSHNLNKGENFSSGGGVTAGYVFKFTMIGIGLMLLGVVIFYIGYKMMLRRELETQVNDKVNDALSKYYMTEKTDEYAGASFEKFEKKEESNGIKTKIAGEEPDYGIEV